MDNTYLSPEVYFRKTNFIFAKVSPFMRHVEDHWGQVMVK